MELSWDPVKVSVPTYKLVDQPWSTKPYVDYTISLEMNRKRWTLEKRYNQLYSLHKFLVSTGKVDPAIIPSFPSYSVMDLRPLEEVAKERKDVIEYYLEYILNIETVFNAVEVQIFFEFGNALQEPRKTIVIFPLPDTDFSVTQVAVVWKSLVSMGVFVEFATETDWDDIRGRTALQKIPPDVRRSFFELTTSVAFTNPLAWEDMRPTRYSGLVVVGGAGYGMVPFIESKTLQSFVSEYWHLRRPVGAIGEGVILLARTKQKNSPLSIIHSSRTTTYPKPLESVNSYLSKLSFRKKKVQSSEAMYSGSCQSEIVKHLSHPNLLQMSSITKTFFRDSLFESSAFTFQEDFYLSARWDGDSYTFAKNFLDLVLRSEYSTDGDESTYEETYPSTV